MSISKYLSKKTLFLALALLALALIFFRFTNEMSFPDLNWQLRKDEKIDLHPGQPVTQKFIPSRNNLSRIEAFFANTKISPGGKLKMQLFNEDCSSLIRESSLEVSSLDSDKPYQFIFSKIADSKDKALCLKLTFIPKQEGVKSAKMFIVENPPAESISLFSEYENKHYDNFSLAIRPAYRNDNLWQDIIELDKRISQYKPWFLKSYYLLAIAFLFITLSIFIVILLIFI